MTSAANEWLIKVKVNKKKIDREFDILQRIDCSNYKYAADIIILTLTDLKSNSADDKLIFLFVIFPETRISPLGKIWMNC